MRRLVRRRDFSPRLELVPMIDVIFVLLTFFIWSVVTMVRAEVLPVRLTAMTASGSGARPAVVQAITVDRQGKLYFNRQAVTEAELDRKLAELAKDPAKPPLFLAMESRGDVDRGPLLFTILQRAQAAGIEDFRIVGQPTAKTETGN